MCKARTMVVKNLIVLFLAVQTYGFQFATGHQAENSDTEKQSGSYSNLNILRCMDRVNTALENTLQRAQTAEREISELRSTVAQNRADEHFFSRKMKHLTAVWTNATEYMNALAKMAEQLETSMVNSSCDQLLSDISPDILKPRLPDLFYLNVKELNSKTVAELFPQVTAKRHFYYKTYLSDGHEEERK